MEMRQLSMAIIGALLLLAAGPVQAGSPEQVGKFGSWMAMKFDEDGHLACYALSEPARKEGNYTRRGNVYVLVTHRPAQKSIGVVSFTAGYDYKPDSSVQVDIDGQGFTLYTQGNTAWAQDADDHKIVEAMRVGKTLIVRGTSSRGTDTVDTYSLLGFGKAYQAINDTCQVQD
jgi:Invasion associated locus B (IalB) protein